MNKEKFPNGLEELIDHVKSLGISYIKWDMNKALTDVSLGDTAKDKELWFGHVKALYEIWAELRKQFPNVEFETCAGGGSRIDLGILRYADPCWPSDNTDTFTLEAGFFLPAALSEMFVHRSADTIYIGYGIPEEWSSRFYKNMTVEGGHKVSVEIEQYQLKRVTIEAGCDEIVQIKFFQPSKKVEINSETLDCPDYVQVPLTKERKVIFSFQ